MSLNVEVTSLGGRLGFVTVGAQATVREVRAAIAESLGVPTTEQRLVHGVQELHEEATTVQSLATEGAKQESLHLQLVRRPAEQVQWLRELAFANPQQAYGMLRDLPPCAQEDREVVLAAVAKHGDALEYAATELRSNRTVVLAALAKNGYALKHASTELQSDREVVLAALAQNGLALQHAATELQADHEVVLAAVSQHGHALWFTAAEFRSDREVVLAAVASCGYALQHASAGLQADREVVLAAVSQNGHALQHAAATLRADREVVLTALAQKGFALQHASMELRADRKLVLAAVSQDQLAPTLTSALLPAVGHSASVRIARELQTLAAALDELLLEDGFALRFAATELRSDREVVLTALAQEGRALHLAAPELRSDPEVLRAAGHLPVGRTDCCWDWDRDWEEVEVTCCSEPSCRMA